MHRHLPELCSVSPLEKVSRRAKRLVTIPRVADCDALHDLAERPLCDLQQCVQVIGHPAEGVNPDFEPTDDTSDDIVERVSIGCVAKQRFAMIASHDDVVVSAWYMQSRRSWHPCRSMEVRGGRLSRWKLQWVAQKSANGRKSNPAPFLPR